jgi:hypothetical protein
MITVAKPPGDNTQPAKQNLRLEARNDLFVIRPVII